MSQVQDERHRLAGAYERSLAIIALLVLSRRRVVSISRATG